MIQKIKAQIDAAHWTGSAHTINAVAKILENCESLLEAKEKISRMQKMICETNKEHQNKAA